MKKILALMLSAVLAVAALTACSGNSGSPAGSADSTVSAGSTAASSATPAASGDAKKIGVIQLAPHPALDSAYEGFVEGLAENGYVDGENITIDLQNAQGEISNCPTIASKLVNNNSDLILAIATPSAQAVAEKTTDIPVLITAVTDPEKSNLVESNEMPGNNVTGTSDLTPVREQLELLKELLPDAKKVGFLYCSSEANSIVQIDIAKESADELGLAYEEFTISNTNELQSVVTSMVGKVDAIYTPTDNMVATGISTVATIANENKIPLIAGEEAMVDGGALASVSVDYYQLGKITGEMAAQVLSGKSEPATMPIQYQETYERVFNQSTADALGIKVPNS